jgi:hypothetical protein
MVFKEM